MEKNCRLWSLSPGDWGQVTRVPRKEPLASRLADLGLLPGAEVQYLFPAPAGEPRAFRIRGAVVALREEDCQGIWLLPIRKDLDPK